MPSFEKPTVGIDDMALYVPKIYFDIKELADARNIEYAKLNRGLGLEKMAIPDAHEDAATMAANAIGQLIDKNNLDPRKIGRIYLGTESALDGSKPTATYALGMLEARYAAKYGENCFNHCDAVDLTFACVGGVDALQNTLDWVANGADRMGIVVTSDNAKYELASSGEYTQGAGAVALLVTQNPRLIALSDTWGVATKSVHDFYKPKRTATKLQILEEALDLIAYKNGSLKYILDRLPNTLEVNGVLDSNDSVVTIHKDTPVFDGQYSNQCYQDRVGEAVKHFRAKRGMTDATSLLNNWERIVFHLPYAFHAKRIFSEVYMKDKKGNGEWEAIKSTVGFDEPQKEDFETTTDYNKATAKYLKAVSKTPAYKAFVKEKIEKGQRASSLVGNMYTCSIFLALMSVLEADWQEDVDLDGKKFGFVSYGSGSKSKVFEGTLQPTWKEVVAKFRVFDTLGERNAIEYQTYQDLHTGTKGESVHAPNGEYALVKIGESGVEEGARYYKYV